MDRKTHVNLWYFVLAFLGVLALQSLFVETRQVESLPYSEFRRAVAAGELKNLRVSADTIRGEFVTPRGEATEFVTVRVDPAVAAELAKSGVQFTGTVENTLLRDLLSWIVPVVLFVALWWFLIRKLAERQGMGGFMSIGKSRAKIYVETDTKVGFADVAGVDEAKAELQEIVEFLRAPERYGRLGAHIPKGVLLIGPPGTGKTLLARAVAGEAAVPFFSISGSEFVEMFVGVGAARVRDLFEQARGRAPAIIFVDELDALGRARSSFTGMGGHDEREQTLNQLLSELDGFDPTSGLVLLAATNRPEILDPALLRAGRFDRQVLVDRPDRIGRAQILHVHMKKISTGSSVDADEIAALTTGFTGADLANLVNEAALLATRRRAETVEGEDFTQAIERIVAGLEKRNRILNPMERRIIAYHETGHALVALALGTTEQVHKVSIIPRGVGALGYTIQRPTEDRYLMTRTELESKIAVLLGGRAAEQLVFDQLSTGASDDLAKATEIARSMVARYGMDETLGTVTYDEERQGFLPQAGLPLPQQRRFSEQTAREIDEAVRTILHDVFQRALAVLQDNRAVLDRTAGSLLEQETLDAEALAGLTTDLRRAA